MVTLDLDRDDCKNAADMIEIYLPQAFKDFYDAGEFDNIEYVRSMLKIYDELKKGAEGKRDIPKLELSPISNGEPDVIYYYKGEEFARTVDKDGET